MAIISFLVAFLAMTAPYTRPESPNPVPLIGWVQRSAELCNNSVPIHKWTPLRSRAWVPLGGRLEPIPSIRPAVPSIGDWKPKYCIVARSYAAQAPVQTLYSVDRFLASIVMQKNPNWFLIILDTDPSKPYPYLHNDVQQWALKNEPFRVTIRNVSDFPDLEAHPEEVAFESLHRSVYYKTDLTIRSVCPSESERLVVTNADNFYDSEFLERVDAQLAANSTPIVGTDFYTRHAFWVWGVDPKTQNCISLLHHPPSICNGFALGRLDLGSLVFDLARWRAEDVRFSSIVCNAPSQLDGCVVQNLIYKSNWTTYRIPETLFSHAPNPWLCFLYGGQILHLPTDADDDQYTCVPSRFNAELVSQEQLSTVSLPHGTCYHGARYDTAIDPFAVANNSTYPSTLPAYTVLPPDPEPASHNPSPTPE